MDVNTTTNEPQYIFDIDEDQATGEFIVNIPDLHLSHRDKTFQDAAEWAMEQIALAQGLPTLVPTTNQEDATH